MGLYIEKHQLSTRDNVSLYRAATLSTRGNVGLYIAVTSSTRDNVGLNTATITRGKVGLYIEALYKRQCGSLYSSSLLEAKAMWVSIQHLHVSIRGNVGLYKAAL